MTQYKIFNPDFKGRIERFLEKQFFMKVVGIELNVIEKGRTEGRLKLDQNHQQQTGLVHGGVIATIADVVAGFAAYTLMPETHHVVTAELKISYLSPGRGDELVANGWVLKQGRKLNFCEAEVYVLHQGRKTLIAKATTTMATIFPEETSKNIKE